LETVASPAGEATNFRLKVILKLKNSIVLHLPHPTRDRTLISTYFLFASLINFKDPLNPSSYAGRSAASDAKLGPPCIGRGVGRFNETWRQAG
jgi:hypothetical protein